MKIRTPFQSLQEHLPFSGGRSGIQTEHNPVDSYANKEGEAERIEAERRELIGRSDEIRLGLDPKPAKTVRSLGRIAESFAASNAPDWEKALALTEVAANLHGGGLEGNSTVQNITQYAIAALEVARPKNPSHPYLDQVHADEIMVRRGAISRTSPEVAFPQAMEQEWVGRNRPLDPLIDSTGHVVKAADEEKAKLEAARAEEEARSTARRAEAAKLTTGVLEKFDPFADDDNESAAKKITP